MKSRRDKIEALLSSPNEGERLAAEAALSRMPAEPIPARGSVEWFEARRGFNARIDFCLSRMGTQGLTPQEVRTVRMLARHRGNPWDRGAEHLPPIYEKLKAAENKGKAVTSAIECGNKIPQKVMR